VLQVAQKDASYTVVPRINPGKCPAAFDWIFSQEIFSHFVYFLSSIFDIGMVYVLTIQKFPEAFRKLKLWCAMNEVYHHGQNRASPKSTVSSMHDVLNVTVSFAAGRRNRLFRPCRGNNCVQSIACDRTVYLNMYPPVFFHPCSNLRNTKRSYFRSNVPKTQSRHEISIFLLTYMIYVDTYEQSFSHVHYSVRN
jgi:hypothetical protein